MAVPRLATRGADGGVSLPTPLAPSDAARVRRIFAMQGRGDLAGAARETAQLADQLLTGTILADRYLGRFNRPEAAELKEWLDRFGDQPDAPAIHALLLHRLPKGEAPPPAPRMAALDEPAPAEPQEDPPDRFPAEAAPSPALWRAVTDRTHAGNAASAMHLIAGTRGLSPAQASALRGGVAQVLFTLNKDGDVLDIATEASRRTPRDQDAGLAALMAGLAAWRLDFPELAATNFEQAARATMASPSIRAAGAFWAARAHRRYGDTAAYWPWMRRAAAEARTFYGLLAGRVLGFDLGATSERATLSQADVDAIAGLAGARRAFALLQVGQYDRADAEFRNLWPEIKDNPALIHSLMLVAGNAGLPDLAAQLAAFEPESSGGVTPLRVPLPRLAPRGGFRIDPALVYALTRLESNFDAGAVSPAGAHGLMQIMPVTARYIAGNPSLAGSELRDPGYNLDLGQRYVTYLAQQDGIEGNLLRMLAAYNAGPGSFARWSAALHDKGDPLLFVEAIPNSETRNFVRHALTYTWLYAARMRLPAHGLDELVAGLFPSFTGENAHAKLAGASARLH
jgi:soluble lytic murein transglycosylase-like protein